LKLGYGLGYVRVAIDDASNIGDCFLHGLSEHLSRGGAWRGFAIVF